MQLKTYKTLWGNQLIIEEACAQAKNAGFDGIEGRAPVTPAAIKRWQNALYAFECEFVLEVVTGGDYVPDLSWTMPYHLQDMEAQIQKSLPLNPRLITLITGSDAWSETQSIEFLEQAMTLEQKYGIPLSFETHRSRCMFNPWVTERIVKALPNLKLTADISHWCVVCERLMSLALPSIQAILPQVFHIHARVGYAQGPQVPHPASPEYQNALHAHQAIWRAIWQSQINRGFEVTTLTPEFGPDGYCQQVPFTQTPVADIWKINQWMNQIERADFANFSQAGALI